MVADTVAVQHGLQGLDSVVLREHRLAVRPAAQCTMCICVCRHVRVCVSVSFKALNHRACALESVAMLSGMYARVRACMSQWLRTHKLRLAE